MMGIQPKQLQGRFMQSIFVGLQIQGIFFCFEHSRCKIEYRLTAVCADDSLCHYLVTPETSQVLQGLMGVLNFNDYFQGPFFNKPGKLAACTFAQGTSSSIFKGRVNIKVSVSAICFQRYK